MSNVTTISRGGLSAKVDSQGAQLTSLALDGREYLWQADPRWWGRSAPVLFPIAGVLPGGESMSAAGPCRMGRHGLARLYEHTLVDASADGASVTYEFTDTPETRAAYPYRFKLNMTYALTGPATLAQTFTVTNTGSVDLPFSVGGHPAFNVPVPGAAEEGEAFEDYELVFAEPWSCTCPRLDEEGLFDMSTALLEFEDADILPITHRTFDHDALMFSHVPQNTVTLRGTRTGHGIRVDFPGFDFLGVWSAAGDAPFVALEPWSAHSSCVGEDGVFEHKEGMTILAPGGVDERTFTITLL